MVGDRVEAKSSGDIGEAAGALVAKCLHSVADGEEVKPAIIVIIDEIDSGGAWLGQGDSLLFLKAVESDLQFAVGQADKVNSQIVVEVACGQRAGGGQGGEGVGR